MRLPPDAEIVVNRLGEPVGVENFTALLIRTPCIEVEARWIAIARQYWIWGSVLHADGKPSYVFATREAPHVRGALAIVTGLVRRELSTVES